MPLDYSTSLYRDSYRAPRWRRAICDLCIGVKAFICDGVPARVVGFVDEPFGVKSALMNE